MKLPNSIFVSLLNIVNRKKIARLDDNCLGKDKAEYIVNGKTNKMLSIFPQMFVLMSKYMPQ